jgi:hypothetical protein
MSELGSKLLSLLTELTARRGNQRIMTFRLVAKLKMNRNYCTFLSPRHHHTCRLKKRFLGFVAAAQQAQNEIVATSYLEDTVQKIASLQQVGTTYAKSAKTWQLAVDNDLRVE